MNDLSLQAAVVVNSEQAETAFDRVGDKAQQMANEVSTSATKAGQAVDKIGDGAGASAEKFTRAESRISASIKRATTELELLGKTASQRLEFNIADKGLDASKFEPALKKLREIEAQAMQAQRAATGSLDKMGVSAAQTAAALRGVPAQFTDIITSLQGGQAPLTVLLQQGGQLKDMFGGVGNAAKALGGYVVGLINPFTLAAAAVGGIAVAYMQGSKEADAYRTALITTGNAAGTNAAQLKSYAQEISGIVGTQGKAAESLAALASTGKVGAESLRDAAKAAVEYERAGVQAVGKTAEQFASLRNEPLAAVLKLNEGMNFLTDSTYKQIKSLEEQGKTAEAANVAQRAFADTLSGRAGEMERNLGTVERGWIAVKDAAKSAWDAILNVGRASTSVDQLAEVRKQIAARENQLANDGFGSNGGGAAFGRPSSANSARLSAELTALKAQAAALEGVAFASKTAAEAERQRGESVKASAAFDKAGERFLTDKVKMERELAVARTQGAEAGRSQAEIEKRLGEIRASYAKKGGGGVAAENKELRDQQRIFAELAGVSSTYYSDLANYQKQRAAGVVTEDQYVAAVEKLIQKQPFAVALVKEETEANKALSKSYAEAAAERIKTIQSMERAADSLQSQNDALREEIELIGLSTEQQTLVLQQRNDVIILTKEATLAELERQSAITGTQTRVEIALASEIDALKERNALLGAKGVKNAAVDAAKSAADEWQKTSDKINDTLTDALMRGFESGKDFAKNLRDTVVNMFKTMVLRPVISAIVNPVAGAVTGMLGLSGAANAATGGSNMLGMALQGTSLYSGLTSGTGVLGSIGNAIGLGAGVSSTMGGLGATAIGSYAAPSVAAMTIAPGATAAGAGGMSGALAAIPGWGWALAGVAALGMLAKKFDDSGTPHIGAGAVYSEAGGLQQGAGIYNRGTFGMGATGEYAQGTQAGVSAIATGLAQTFDGLAKAFGKTAGYEIATAFADDSSKDGAWGSFRISQGGQDLLNWENDRQSKWAPREFANGEEGYKQYMAEIAKGARTALVSAIGDVSWAKDMLTAIGESASMEQLSSTVQQIAAIKTQFVQLGKAMEMFDGISSGMESALLSAAGSIDALTSSAAGYYDAVYTQQEKIARSRAQLETTLAGYGQSLPATREQYRALVEQQMAAGESGAEFAVVLMGLASTFTQVADDIDAQFAEIGKSAAEVFEKLLADIGRVRGDVAGTRADMLASSQAMTPAQIAAAVNAAMVYAPNTAGIVSAQGGVASAASQLAPAQQGKNYWSGVANPLADGVAQTQQTIAALDEWFGGVQKSFDAFTAYRDWAWSGAGTYRESMALIPENERRTAQYGADQASYTSQRQAAEAQLAQQQAALSAASAEAGRYAQQLAAAQAAVVAAQRAEVQARVDYAAQISQFVTAAGGSVSKLSGLREEVVRYYEAQEQAVQSMIATAENLRNVVDGIRMGQLDSAQTAAQLGSSYASDYSMALATTGATRAGYADSMAATLPTLAEAIKAEASTASDWRVQTGKLLAQATGVAGMLEADAAGTDYQTTSLGLLDSIDSALAQLEGSTKSAEQVIAQAINDGTASQLTGLRAIVAALRGEPIPAFAAGGLHAGGLRLVGENGPELEATGQSRIWSAQQTAALLSGNGGNNEALVAEIRALREDNQAQAAAMVQMQRELTKLMQRWDAQGMPEVRVI